MKTLSLTEIEAKTARELVTNQFKEDLLKVIGEDLKTYLPAFKKGLRNTENLIPTLKMLIADAALNLHWVLIDENITVSGHNFKCAFALESIGLIAERWGKEPKLPKGLVPKKPENCTRHLKFGFWFKAIKEGTVRVEEGKVLKLVGFQDENEVFCEFGKYFKVPNTPNFKLYTFNAFSLDNENSGIMNITNETKAFIQFYHQITGK
jgi:hypothetical protein